MSKRQALSQEINGVNGDATITSKLALLHQEDIEANYFQKKSPA
jgi:hypothetical protein